MIKEIRIAKCDRCGKEENMKIITGKNGETDYRLPMGWEYFDGQHLCRSCLNMRLYIIYTCRNREM